VALQQDARLKGAPIKSASGTRHAGLHIPDALRSEYVNVTEVRQLQVRRCGLWRRDAPAFSLFTMRFGRTQSPGMDFGYQKKSASGTRRTPLNYRYFFAADCRI